jgi:hypothetical protein
VAFLRGVLTWDTPVNSSSDVWPVALIVASVIAAIVTAGLASGSVSASVAAGGSAGGIASTSSVAVASSLVGAGLPAGTVLYVTAVGAAVVKTVIGSAGVKLALTELTEQSLGDAVNTDVLTLSRSGMYAGPLLPRQKPLVMIIEGELAEDNIWTEGECISALLASPLKLMIPCLDDAYLCLEGTSCNDCCNGSSYWDGLVFTACGNEPAWPDGTLCAEGTTCNNCANDSSFWAGKVFTACGTEGCWDKDTLCLGGTTCNTCCSGSTWSWSGFGYYCN